MLETLQHFAFEAVTGVVGLALIAAGMALWSAPQGWLIGNIPIIGRLVEDAKRAIAAVLFAAGFAAIAYMAGYVHRGTVEQAAALRDRIATQEAIKAESERRDEAFANARAADAEYADALAVADELLEASTAMSTDAKHDAESDDASTALRGEALATRAQALAGLQVLVAMRARQLAVPFILVSGQIGEETAVEAMRNGASDYLLKNRLARLAPLVPPGRRDRAAAAVGRVTPAAPRSTSISRRWAAPCSTWSARPVSIWRSCPTAGRTMR